ncbi:hypothetical protein [Chryseobacterium sp. SIMBA_028]|uniref:hypothetical protein n=1 Tax=Chryseobacterium sp. SIMBA_028 TaxID=3085771 RepID=UPI00397C46AC
MDKNDFENFTQEVSWFVRPADRVELEHRISKNFSPRFIATFPILYHLLLQSTSITRVNITSSKNKESSYYLHTWIDRNGFRCGWLCDTEKIQTEIEILTEHQLLLDEMGGIKETYHYFDAGSEMLTDNQNFIFIKSGLTKGLGDWTDLYDQVCKDEQVKQIDTDDLICFAQEANGNETYYNLNTKQVLLFAADHSFENIEVLKDHSEYTFYTINEITTLVDYVEKLAQQWLQNIIPAED